ncbi:hypothetical protein SARC_03386 [Sphaeroforma arctica JP610]|uniref:Uncharacterized protein n=1 Tax=Sphaeroforma arctica JP610 TaxID=667725 RepID=A0A0L0G820_9EUKA|nr:hypothetical protein SARC_03386 [Sphaeroforma arctica JP610]KNC84393.1 hypothetical protein SARC_03386 [Sphaeroforma arctica JP610]|eukprot:XP_014158295.1 hypothetical protein SARC_03386 [Sphaeroforma arctica JP610]
MSAPFANLTASIAHSSPRIEESVRDGPSSSQPSELTVKNSVGTEAETVVPAEISAPTEKSDSVVPMIGSAIVVPLAAVPAVSMSRGVEDELPATAESIIPNVNTGRKDTIEESKAPVENSPNIDTISTAIAKTDSQPKTSIDTKTNADIGSTSNTNTCGSTQPEKSQNSSASDETDTQNSGSTDVPVLENVPPTTTNRNTGATRSPTPPTTAKALPYVESAEDAAKFKKSCDNLTRKFKSESKVLNTEVRTILSWHFERLVVGKQWKGVKEFLSMWKDQVPVDETYLLIAHITCALSNKDDVVARANLLQTIDALEVLYQIASNAKTSRKAYERMIRSVKLQKIVQMRIDAVTVPGTKHTQLLENMRHAIDEFFPEDDAAAQTTRKRALAITHESSSAFEEYFSETAETDLIIATQQAMAFATSVVAALEPYHLRKLSDKFTEVLTARKRAAEDNSQTGTASKRARQDANPAINIS